MLMRLWRWLVQDVEEERRREDRELTREILLTLKDVSTSNNQLLTRWLEMFKPSAEPVKGWTASDEAVALQEFARTRGLEVPRELVTGSELDRTNWLEREMEKDW